MSLVSPDGPPFRENMNGRPRMQHLSCGGAGSAAHLSSASVMADTKACDPSLLRPFSPLLFTLSTRNCFRFSRLHHPFARQLNDVKSLKELRSQASKAFSVTTSSCVFQILRVPMSANKDQCPRKVTRLIEGLLCLPLVCSALPWVYRRIPWCVTFEKLGPLRSQFGPRYQ